MPAFPYVTLDVFTDRPLTGNQLAVFTDAPEIPEELLQPLAAEMAFSETVFLYDNGVPHLYVTLADEDAVAALDPDLGAIARIAVDGPVPLVGVNAIAGAGSRWKTRMFAPADGVPEDPASGSAAGPLAVHLARHGRIAFGQEIEISQGVEIARPSTLIAVAHGTPDAIAAVEVAGTAVFVGEGSITLA